VNNGKEHPFPEDQEIEGFPKLPSTIDLCMLEGEVIINIFFEKHGYEAVPT
jgi:hypothetical protein